jgi:hypothetical protein
LLTQRSSNFTVAACDRDFRSPPWPVSRSPRSFISRSSSPARISARMRRVLAAAQTTEQVKRVVDQTSILIAAARRATDSELEAELDALKFEAERRLGQLMQAQKDTVGLATGGEHGGKNPIDGLRKNPSNARPTLADAGIDKNLADRARKAAKLTDAEFEKAKQERCVAIKFAKPPLDRALDQTGRPFIRNNTRGFVAASELRSARSCCIAKASSFPSRRLSQRLSSRRRFVPLDL